MAELNTEQGGAEKGKHKKVRSKKSSTHIDMTPMVDLAFLLLTFFMLSTTFSKPKTMEITMPVKDKPEKESIINNAVTLLLTDKNRIYWYFGEFKPEETQLQEASFSPDASNSLRKILLDKNRDANDRIRDLEKKVVRGEMKDDTTFKQMRIKIKSENKSLFVLIKTDDKAKYKNVIDALDECNIANVGKYALVDIMQKEFEMVQAKAQ